MHLWDRVPRSVVGGSPLECSRIRGEAPKARAENQPSMPKAPKLLTGRRATCSGIELDITGSMEPDQRSDLFFQGLRFFLALDIAQREHFSVDQGLGIEVEHQIEQAILIGTEGREIQGLFGTRHSRPKAAEMPPELYDPTGQDGFADKPLYTVSGDGEDSHALRQRGQSDL